MYKGHETPAYTVERTVAEAEIRAYPPVLVAEVTAAGSRSGAAGEASARSRAISSGETRPPRRWR